MSDDYLWNRSGAPDPEVKRLEDLLAPLAHDAPLAAAPRRKRRAPWIATGVAFCAAAAAVLLIRTPPRRDVTCAEGSGSGSVAHTNDSCRMAALQPRDPRCSGEGSGFEFAAKSGDVRCNGAPAGRGVLPVGGELRTTADEVVLQIADIGTATLGKHTTVRLERTDAERHQLHLERGHLHARVIAVPRLFAVTTKHADVVDLGCEYTIDVDERGVGRICVLSGQVELGTKSGAVVVAPLGSCAAILDSNRPGLPVSTAASGPLRNAVLAYDRGEPGAREALLTAATDRDAITLIALAAIDPQASSVLERLAQLSPPPDVEITVETALADPAKLAAWRADILEIWNGLYRPAAR